MYAGTMEYRSREVLKGELVKKAMKMREGQVYAECSKMHTCILKMK